jgi:hypothetical protein
MTTIDLYGLSWKDVAGIWKAKVDNLEAYVYSVGGGKFGWQLSDSGELVDQDTRYDEDIPSMNKAMFFAQRAMQKRMIENEKK